MEVARGWMGNSWLHSSTMWFYQGQNYQKMVLHLGFSQTTLHKTSPYGICANYTRTHKILAPRFSFRLLCGKLAAPCNTRLRSLIFFHSTHQQRKEGGASALYAIFRNSVLKIKILFYVFCLSERVCVWFINIRKRLTFHIKTDRLGNKSFAIFSIENVDLVRKQLTLVETEKLVDIQFNFKTS